jgi:hypothetical protein
LLAFLDGAFAQSVAPPGGLSTLVQASPSYHHGVLARGAVGAEGELTGAVLALVGITVIIAAATIVIYRRST